MKTGLQIGLIAVALVAGPLAAQQHQHGDSTAGAGKEQASIGECSMMGGMMSMMGAGGGMEMMRFAPSHVLKHKGSLKLTAGQLSRIEAMAGGGMEEHGMGTAGNSMMKMMQARQAQLQKAFDMVPADSAAIQAAVKPMAAMHGSMMSQHLLVAARVRDALTPTQREQLKKSPPPCMMTEGDMMMKGKMPEPKP